MADEVATREWTYIECAGCICDHDHGGSASRRADAVCADCGCEGEERTMQVAVGSQGPLLVRLPAEPEAEPKRKRRSRS